MALLVKKREKGRERGRERKRIGEKKRLTQGHSHGTLRKEVPLIPSKPEKSAINLCCSLPPPAAIVALVVDHFGNIWSWVFFGGQMTPINVAKKITLVSHAVAVVLLVRTENAGFVCEYLMQKKEKDQTF